MNVPEHLEYSYLLGVRVFLVQLVERFNSAKYYLLNNIVSIKWNVNTLRLVHFSDNNVAFHHTISASWKSAFTGCWSFFQIPETSRQREWISSGIISTLLDLHSRSLSIDQYLTKPTKYSSCGESFVKHMRKGTVLFFVRNTPK